MRADDRTVDELVPLLRQSLSRRDALIVGAGLAAGLSAVEILAACANNSSTSNNAVHADTLNIAVQTIDGPGTGDPIILQNYVTGYAPVWASTEQLYARDVSGKMTPGLATEWKVASDNLTWTITTRTGVKMQDGSTFSAQDVVTGIDRLFKNPKYGQVIYGNFLKNVASYKALDDTHVQIITKAPYSTLIIDCPPPVPTNYYKQVGDDKYSAQPIQAGPFKFVSYQPQQSYTYVRHDDYWDKTRFPNFKNLVFKIVPDESTRVAGFLAGQIDLLQGISYQAVQQIQGSGKGKTLRNDNVACGQMYVQSLYTEPNSPVQDVRVRQAMLYALDRPTLIKTIYRGAATMESIAIPPSAAGFDPKLTPLPFDLQKAKQLMAEAGASGGFSFPINYGNQDSSNPQVANEAQAIQQYWAAINIKADLNPLDGATLQATRRAGKMKGGYLAAGVALSWLELASVSQNIYLSNSTVHIMQDPKVDGIVQRMAVTLNDADRAKIGTELCDYFYQQQYVLPLVGLPSFIAYGPTVKSVKAQGGNPYVNPWFLRAN
jgi:peptide/nickel transport system substrate-binding protein